MEAVPIHLKHTVMAEKKVLRFNNLRINIFVLLWMVGQKLQAI